MAITITITIAYQGEFKVDEPHHRAVDAVVSIVRPLLAGVDRNGREY
jgi:hypothetical protein